MSEDKCRYPVRAVPRKDDGGSDKETILTALDQNQIVDRYLTGVPRSWLLSCMPRPGSGIELRSKRTQTRARTYYA